MKRLAILQSVSATVLCAALVAAFFISPFTAGAANTFSTQLNSASSQYFSATDSTSLSVTGDITVEAWIKPASMPSGVSEYIAAKGSTNGFNAWRLMSAWNPTTSKHNLHFEIDRSGSNTDAVAYSYADVDLASYIGTWVHVAATWSAVSGSATPKLYINGSEVGAYSIQGNDGGADAIADTDSPTYIGSSPTDALYFNGKIDDVRVYNVARSASAIASDYGQELNGNESGLVAYWKLNNDGGVDATANGNTLSGINGPTYSTDVPFPVIPPFTEVRKVRKSVDESVASSVTLQNDDQMKLSLVANKTYIVDGVIFASATNGTPDLKISFSGVLGTVATIGYTNDVSEEVLGNNTTSSRIAVGTTPKSIHVHGTVVTGGSNGDFQLKWAQNTSNSHPTSVLLGSYLRAEEI